MIATGAKRRTHTTQTAISRHSMGDTGGKKENTQINSILQATIVGGTAITERLNTR